MELTGFGLRQIFSKIPALPLSLFGGHEGPFIPHMQQVEQVLTPDDITKPQKCLKFTIS